MIEADSSRPFQALSKMPWDRATWSHVGLRSDPPAPPSQWAAGGSPRQDVAVERVIAACSSAGRGAAHGQMFESIVAPACSVSRAAMGHPTRGKAYEAYVAETAEKRKTLRMMTD